MNVNQGKLRELNELRELDYSCKVQSSIIALTTKSKVHRKFPEINRKTINMPNQSVNKVILIQQ